MNGDSKAFSGVAKLREVDSAEIISLMDNSVDFLSTIEKEEVKQVAPEIVELKNEIHRSANQTNRIST